MSGTKLGASKAKETILKRHGADFWTKIGAKGGKVSSTGGFFGDRDLARRAGKIGGTISRRGPGMSTVAHYRRLKKEKENG